MEHPPLRKEVVSKIETIANNPNQDDPFYVLDLSELTRKYDYFLKAMPRVHPYYAVKCNSDKDMVKKLAELGAGFDCASREEIRQVTDLGVHPSRIIYANTTKPSSHIAYANSRGVDLMTFDNESELYRIKNINPKSRLVIRIRYEDRAALGSYGRKFGCGVEDEAPILVEKAASLGLQVVGVAFHLGLGCSMNAFADALEACKKVSDCAKRFGFEFNLVNIGGGFPGSTGSSIDEYAAVVNKSLDKYFPDKSVKIISEPGQYFACPAFTLACRVMSIRNYSQKNSAGELEEDVMYFINDGIHGSFSLVIGFKFNLMQAPLKVRANAKTRKSSLWGPTCDSRDKILENLYLPEMNVDDWIVFRDIGAYSLSNLSTFNGFQCPKVYVLEN